MDRLHTVEWAIQQKKCFERDGYKCRISGETKNLHAHHIIPHHESHCDELWNLITLSEKYHTKEENEYRRVGKTNRLQRMIDENKRLELCQKK